MSQPSDTPEMPAAPDTPASAAVPPQPPRKIADPLALRAVAHPMRINLMGLIGFNGSLTASQAARELGSTPAVTAYHLRTLAKYGFVEDADSSSARERPWRLTQQGISFSWNNDDPAGRVLSRVTYGEWFEHVKHYLAHIDEYPQDVRDASSATEQVLFATPAEVKELTDKIHNLLEPFKSRIDVALRPPDVIPMEILLFTHPVSVEPSE